MRSEGTRPMAQLRARFRNDVLWGGDEADTIVGSAGHDVLYGGGGDDWILGGDGQDTLNGGTGRDTLDGGAGHDALFGGEGEDWLSGGTGNDTLSGGAGHDRLAGGAGNDTTDGGAGDDVIVDDGGNDLIVGGQGNDTITGGGGNDVISGGPGHDVILGGAGNDTVDGGAGNDTIEGRGGQDRLSGGEGDDRITGGAGSDSIDGAAGNDTLDGRGGDDSLAGGAGHDQLDGGAGSDRVNAGAGNDLGLHAKAANAGAQDSYDGGAGFDTLRIELSAADAASAAVQADLAAYRSFLAANANPARDNGATFNFTTMGLSARNWEALETAVVNQAPSARNDTATALEDGGPIAIDVLANDTDTDAGDSKTLVSVTPSSGAAVSIAGNQAIYDPGALFQFLGASATHADSFRYVMRDAAGATSSATVSVTIAGRNDAPVTQNDTGAATEDGAAVQIDVLANDTDVDSGDTKSIVSVSGGAAGTSVTTDGTRITYNVGTAFQLLAAGQTATDVLTYVMRDAAGATSSASVSVTVTGTADPALHLNGTSSNDVLIGSSGNDSLWGRLGHDTLLGGAGDDYLNGERPYDASEAFKVFFRPSDSDYIDGGDGIDTVDYSDCLYGVTVDLRIQEEQFTRRGQWDTLLNIENIIGSRDGDTLYGNDGKNVIDGGGHIDLIHGFGGDDTLSGSNLHGGSGDDLLLGDLNSSGLFGDEGNDVIRSIASGYVNIHGGTGDDTILSGSSSDTIFGGTGNDVLSGGGSTISPGRGDTFLFRDGDGQDVIGDFGANAHNLIDLRTVAGLPSFAVLSTHFSQVGADTVIALNGGDSITLLNVSVSSLQPDDFLYSTV